MSALRSPLDPVPDAAAQAGQGAIARPGAALRRLPAKAKLGAALLTLFIVVAIVGPWIAV
jgi:hypothetical protein